LNNIINLILGDWSHDGHGRASITTIRSNLTKPEMDEAYIVGTKKVGFSFIEEVGVDFDDYSGCSIDQEQTDMLEEAGVDTSCIDYSDHRIYEEGFVDIYLDIVKLGDDTFEWERVSHEENHIRIGGYGIF